MHSRYLAFAVCFAVSIGAPAGAQLGGQSGPSPEPPPPPGAAPARTRTAAAKGSAQISQYVREIYQDREGNLWLGTNGEGVARYDGESLEFFGPAQGFGGVAVRGMIQDADGAMWFATDMGVTKYAGGRFRNYTTRDGLSQPDVWSILLDSSGTIWAGTHGGVCRLEGERFVPFALPRVTVERPESRFSPLVVFAMHKDRDGNLWFGTDGEGAHRYDGESFVSYTTDNGLGGNMVRSIAGDRRGRVWVGSDGGGVSRLDGDQWRTFTAEDGLNNDRVYEIREDRAGNMWFSTLGAGASRYDGAEFRSFGVAEGLSVNDLPCPCGSGREYSACHGPGGGHVQEIFEDRDGVLWFGCSGGLFRLEGERFVNVTREGPWKATARNPAPAKIADPLTGFAGLLSGEWRMTP